MSNRKDRSGVPLRPWLYVSPTTSNSNKMQVSREKTGALFWWRSQSTFL